jgi:hypothetical protein
LQPASTFNLVQVELSLHDHAELVDWMAEVIFQQDMLVDVLFLSVHMMDCVLKTKPLKRCSFQLLGAACLFLASKLEEIQAISAESIVVLAGGAFSVKDLLRMEIFVTTVLDFKFNIPSRLHFLERIIFVSRLSERESQFARYLLELSLHVRLRLCACSWNFDLFLFIGLHIQSF